MRENTKWIMLITAIAFVALMVFEWGMDMTGRSGAQATGGELGRVNGQIIGYDEYLTVYRNLYQQQQQQAPDGIITPAMNRQIQDAAWDQMITQRLLDQELRRRGIRVSDEEIRQAALYAPPPELQQAPDFQTDGQFDPAKYQQFLASPNLPDEFLRQLESYYRDVVPRSKLFFQVAAGLTVSDAQLWRMWRDANEMATVRYIRFLPEAMIPDAEVSVTDQAIRQYYNSRRADFVRPAQASVRYVSLDRTPTAADSAAAAQRAAQHRAELMAGEDFDAVARRAAGDEETETTAPTFPVSRGQAAEPLDQAIFNTPVGQVSEPVLTMAGYHLIRVDSRDGDVAEVRQILVPITLSQEAEDRLLDRADSLERAANRANLEQAAASMGLQVSTADLTPALPILPGVGPVDEGVEWAFDEAEIGEASPVLENEQAYYLMELVSRRDEGTLSLQEATPTIRSLLLRQAKMARARERLVDAERRARAGEPLEQIASAWQSEVADAGPFSRGSFVPGLGRMNAAVGAAFGLRAGETSPLVEAEQHLFLIRLVSRQDASAAEWQAQVADQRARVLQAMGDTRWNQLMMALRTDAEIVDNRREVIGRSAGGTASF